MVSGLVPLALVPHMIHAIGLGQYGSIAVAIAWANYACVVVFYGFQLTGPARIARQSLDDPPLYVFAEISFAKLALFLGLAPLLVMIALLAPANVPLVPSLLVLLLMPLAAALNSGWYLQAIGRFAWICIFAITGSCISLAMGFLLVTDNGPSSVAHTALALSLGPLFTGLATFLASARGLNMGLRSFTQAKPHKALREGWPLFASQFVSALYTSSGPILINLLLNASAAGAYSAVEKMANTVVGACLLTHTAAYPRLAALYANKREAYWRLLLLVILIYLACTGVTAAVTWLFRDRLSHFLLGATGGQYDALIAWSLLWVVIAVFGTALTGYLTVSGRQNRVMPLTLKILLVALMLGIPGAYVWGAWAWMASLVLSQLLVVIAGYCYWREEKLLQGQKYAL